MKHNLQHNVVGEIDFEGERWTFTFYYEHGSDLTINNVVRFQAMKTGCYVLFIADGQIVVVPPKFKYYTEQKQEGYVPHGTC